MRFSFLSSVRNDLLQEIADNTDIAPIKAGYVNASISALGTTTLGTGVLFSYTAPANKRAVVLSVGLEAYIFNAITAGGYSFLYVRVKDSGGIVRDSILTLQFATLTTDARWSREVTTEFWLDEGETIELYKSLAGSAGNVAYSGQFVIHEFDK